MASWLPYDRAYFINQERIGILSPPRTPTPVQGINPRIAVSPPINVPAPSPLMSIRTDPYSKRDRAPSYNYYITVNENNGLLIDRHMWMEMADSALDKRQESDAKLKKYIRRIRFAVRSLNLGCRSSQLRFEC